MCFLCRQLDRSRWSWIQAGKRLTLYIFTFTSYGGNIDRLAPKFINCRDEVTTKLPELYSIERLLYAKSKAVICRNSWSETLLLQETA
jgi:hypothetical protein